MDKQQEFVLRTIEERGVKFRGRHASDAGPQYLPNSSLAWNR